jgi:hypothetical protein
LTDNIKLYPITGVSAHTGNDFNRNGAALQFHQGQGFRQGNILFQIRSGLRFFKRRYLPCGQKENKMENRKEYIDKMAARLKEWDTEVEKLEVKAETAKADLKASYNQQINELRLKKAEAQQKLKKIQDAGEDAWEELKEGAEKSWQIFEDSIKNAWGKFK